MAVEISMVSSNSVAAVLALPPDEVIDLYFCIKDLLAAARATDGKRDSHGE